MSINFEVHVRILSAALASMLTISASAYDIEADGLYFTLDLTERTASIDSCDVTKSGVLTISTVVIFKSREFKVTSINARAFSNCKRLSSVTIPNGVNLSEYIFSGCTALQSVSLPSELGEIPTGTFYNCTNLPDISIPKEVTSIGSSAFAGCERLSSMVIPDGMKTLGAYSFERCKALKNLVLPNSIDFIGAHSFDSTALETISLPSSITSLSNALFANSDIESVDVPSSVTEIGDSVFFNSKIETVHLPDGLQKMGKYAFALSSIKSIDIPDDVAIISKGAFLKCTNLIKVNLSSNCKQLCEGAFWGCSSLTSIDIPDNVASIEGNYSSFDYNPAYRSTRMGCFEDCINLQSVHLPKGLTTLSTAAFNGCTNLKYLLLPDNLQDVNLLSFKDSGIEELDLSEDNSGTLYSSYNYSYSSSSHIYWPQNLKRLAIASMQQTSANGGFQLGKSFKPFEKLKVLPQADGFQIYYPSADDKRDAYSLILADSLYLCDSSTPINSYASYRRESKGFAGHNKYTYYRIYGDYTYLYMGRNLALEGESCNIEDCIGDSLQSLVVGPLVTECTMEKADKLQEIESLITVPLQVEPSFPKNVYINVPLIVPDGTKAQYEQAPGWEQFFDIREKHETVTDIRTVPHSNGNSSAAVIYNLNGQRVSEYGKGIRIIKHRDGKTSKVLMK